MKTKILVSACLLGTPCRYDGRNVPVESVIALENDYELIPICPEVCGGLSTPRVPSERINDRVINKDGCDVTANYEKGARVTLDLCKKHGIKVAVLKEKSPSCGSEFIYDGSFSGKLISGEGVTAEFLRKNGITVLGEGKIKKLLEKT